MRDTEKGMRWAASMKETSLSAGSLMRRPQAAHW